MAWRIVVAGGLLVLALGSWQVSRAAGALADRRERLATMNYAGVGASDGAVAGRLQALVDPDASLLEAIARYWSNQPLPDDEDTRLLPMWANLAYRSTARGAGGKPMAPERLDQILQAYATALRQSGFDRDVAYNYEFVARQRDRTRRTRAAAAAPAAGLHGWEGSHPPPTRGEEFEILTPMDYGDREAQPEQTPGMKRQRKG